MQGNESGETTCARAARGLHGVVAAVAVAAGVAMGAGGMPVQAATGPGVVTGDTIVHDPSMLKLGDGRYYI